MLAPIFCGRGRPGGSLPPTRTNAGRGHGRPAQRRTTPADDDEFTDRVINRINASGTAFFSPTTWRGRRAMRVSVCNCRTTPADVALTISAAQSAFRLSPGRRCAHKLGASLLVGVQLRQNWRLNALSLGHLPSGWHLFFGVADAVRDVGVDGGPHHLGNDTNPPPPHAPRDPACGDSRSRHLDPFVLSLGDATPGLRHVLLQ